MKLHATMIPPYAGNIGGLNLIDEGGCTRFMVSIIGTNQGITKEETQTIASALIRGIPDAIDMPDRK